MTITRKMNGGQTLPSVFWLPGPPPNSRLLASAHDCQYTNKPRIQKAFIPPGSVHVRQSVTESERRTWAEKWAGSPGEGGHGKDEGTPFGA